MVRLAVIGIVAGFFSALLGVGGGLITVPLLLLVAHFSERPAMATSLGAIGITALAGTIRYAFHGDVEWGYAALVGLPASVGAVAGTALQQQIASRWLALAFAALLVVVGVLLLVDDVSTICSRSCSGSAPGCSRACSASAAGFSSCRRCSRSI